MSKFGIYTQINDLINPHDKYKNFNEIKETAENNIKEAQYNLAKCYENGEGTERNLEKAFYWYQKAAENGYTNAQVNLAVLYERGEGTKKNLEMTFYWNRKAAENGNTTGQYNLGEH